MGREGQRSVSKGEQYLEGYRHGSFAEAAVQVRTRIIEPHARVLELLLFVFFFLSVSAKG